ncbi:ABC transporter substrate-binding protein [Paenibacillus sp. GCM10023248]|uniref:ABC transporter substrate-binding protein n=1 Tax=Bacillales TaxID=1385 RepID=UPI002378DAE0|nr:MULTISPECIES: ABC transporter substrate-binding protein [Bacillales]MDD9270519.1 ABC transporter substrate-binding protein [Paenibacillus sp. MAHUQ-63]MDR6884116.1 raffinose/stachyose/melibiose transport system substrate-binding protein [Bacillus sp. 3255]
MRKPLWMLAVSVITVALVGGCSSSSVPTTGSSASTPAATGSAESSKKDVTLTYIASQGWIKDTEMQLAKKFESETGIRIDYQIIPADQYFNVLKTKLNAKEGPDLFGGQSGKSEISLNYNVEKNAVDLSDQEWVKREDKLSLEQLSLNGKVYALTIWDTGNSFVVVYNKKIFEKLGLHIPKTYEEFKQASLKIKQAGITPLYEPIADGWHHVLWFAEPGPRYDEVTPNLYNDLNANKKKFVDDPTMKASLTQLKEMYDLGFFGDNAFSDTGADTANKLASGKYAMALSTQSTPNDVAKVNPEWKAEDFGFFPIPLADNQFYYINPGGPSKFVYSGSKHIEEAKQYLAFLAKPENLQYMVDNDKTVSNLNFSGLKDKYTEEQKKLFAAYPKRGTDIQDYVNYVNPQWMDMGKDIVAMFSQSMEPADVLKSIDKRRSDMAGVAKDPAWAK